MAHDDFDVIVYKVLAYMMACVKKGVYPNIDVAKDAAGCNDVYWAMVIESMLDDGLIRNATVKSYYDGTTDVSAGQDFGITQKGARYLKENSKMEEAKRFLGTAFEKALPTLIEATMAISSLM